MVNNETLKGLLKEIPFKWRKGPGGNQLAYIDARQAMDLLDEVVGPANWDRQYKEIGGRLFCGVGIKVDGEWIYKWDTGSESNIEAQKGEVSDAFKRAAVSWGVGRFLYSIKAQKGGGAGGYTGKASEAQVKRMYAIGNKECGFSYPDIDKAIKSRGFDKGSLTVPQVDQLIEAMRGAKK